MKFPLFKDCEIGMKSSSVQESLMDLKKDDDVDTDEEIYDRALKGCSQDFNDARLYMEKSPMN